MQEPGTYSAIIEAVACGRTRANEIAVKVGEESAKCIKYINILCGLGILYKDIPYGEKASSRKTIYGISDFMFRFWYRYVFANRTLLETGAAEVVWERKIESDYSNYMGTVFERICREFLLEKNARGELPVLFTSIGRWWGTDPVTHKQEEIDLVAGDGEEFLFGECKWRNEKADISVLRNLQRKADIFRKNRAKTCYALFSKGGFTEEVYAEQEKMEGILLFDLENLFD